MAESVRTHVIPTNCLIEIRRLYCTSVSIEHVSEKNFHSIYLLAPNSHPIELNQLKLKTGILKIIVLES